MQQVLRNPLASPTTLGVASGAQLALMMVTLLALLAADRAGVDRHGRGSLAMGLVFALAWRRQLNPVVIVFAGLVINLYLAAISMGLLLFFQEELKGLLVWGRISGTRTAGAASAICCHGCCWPRCWRRCWCARWQCWSWTMPALAAWGLSSSICAWLVWVSRVRHRLRGERGGADRFYRAGGARHGAAAGVRKLASGCCGHPSSAPCCWRPPICCCRPEPVLACADPDRRHDGPVGGAAALADPRLGIKRVR
jgi:hypothetical protein